MIGSLMYAALGSRPDIASVLPHSADTISNLSKIHAMAAKESVTISQVHFGISHLLSTLPSSSSPHNLRPYDTPINILGYTNVSKELVMSGLIHWQAKSQSVVALSTLEAEYIACSHATRESLWLKRMLKEAANGMAVKISDGPVPIGCDNQGAIKLIATGVVRQKSKHINVKYHHVHDEQMKGSVKFQYVTSESNPADLLTKPLAVPATRATVATHRTHSIQPLHGGPTNG